MLKSWHVENFKSIAASGELLLAPVTVFSGLNSSGKSSFLQSLLMISQTFSNRVSSRALLPNGSLIQLGRFEDMLNWGTHSSELIIGFTLDFTQEFAEKPLSEEDFDDDLLFIEDTGVPALTIQGLARFEGNAGNISHTTNDAVTIVLKELTLSIHPQMTITDDGILYGAFEVHVVRQTDETFRIFSEHLTPDYVRLIPHSPTEYHYMSQFRRSDSTDEETEDLASLLGPHLVTLTHFLPDRFIRKFNIWTEKEEHLKTLLIYLGFILARDFDEGDFPRELFPRHTALEAPLPDVFKRMIQAHFSEEYAVVGLEYETIHDIRLWFEQLTKAFGEERSQSIRKKCEALLIQFLSEPGPIENQENEGLERVKWNFYELNVQNATKQMIDLFASRIRYLGPLRNDPQASQRFSPGGELGDVGTKGEYAATVYDAHAQTRVSWYHPLHEQVQQGPLQEALAVWLLYLGVAKGVHVTETGQMGFSWLIIQGKGEALPLSAVGVGVSQVLPLLVMGLLSPAYTILVVEQPELHLHPRMQARLGDFFMGLAKCKKQSLIETHSENLINQLRYHIVQAETPEASGCQIYFVDQDDSESTRFQPVQISPQGNILNWPDGFFDETMLQEDKITSASLKKRAGRQHGKHSH